MSAHAHILLDGVQSWKLLLPPNDYSTPNSREHWAKKARKAKQWRADTAILARAAHVPRCERVRVSLEFWPRDRRRRDPDNLLLALKWSIDGLRDANVIADDTGDQVTFTSPVIHPPRDDRETTWVLTIEEAA